MFNLILQNKLAFGAVLLLVLGGVWFGLSSSSAPAPLLQQDKSASGVDQELISTLLTLRAITLSGTIFTDPLFTSLKDFGQEIKLEPVGRPNPFAPLPPSPLLPTDSRAAVFGAGKK